MKTLEMGLNRLALGALLLGAPLALAGDLGASASSTAACCQLTTTLASEAIRPLDVPGDERFFMADGAPPNIHFLMDTSASMRELPQVQNSDQDGFYARSDTDPTNVLHTGCNNPDLLAVQQSRGWNKDTVYPVPDQGTGIGSDKGHPELFRDDKFYAYMTWGASTAPTPTWSTREEACKAQYPRWDTIDAIRYGNCLSCLRDKGFFKKPGVNTYPKHTDGSDSRQNFIFWGRFLNFNPPKYVTAKVVLKQVIKEMRRVRAGMSEFHWDAKDYANNGGKLMRGQNPSCDQIVKDSSSFDSNRGSYISAVDALTFESPGTPLTKALLNVGQYFSASDDVYKTKFGFSDYVFKKEYQNDQLSSQGRSWCWGCQVSSVIVITDGDPGYVGDTLPSTTLTQLTTLNKGAVTCPDDNASCKSATGEDHKLDDVARFLATQDLQQHSPVQVGDLNTAGRQSMSVYTIGFGVDSKLLANTAREGDGEYYTAHSAQALKEAIMEILRNVETRATSFSSTAVASLQVNRAGGTLVPRFKPAKANKPWQGFLYRFSLSPEVLLGCKEGSVDGTGDLNKDGDCDDIHLIDKDGKAVVEDDQGNFVRLEDPLTPARPFWEAGAKLKPHVVAKTEYWKTRRIYTLIDNGSAAGAGVKDNKLDQHDTPIPFVEERAGELQDYLGISNNPNECATLATKLGLASLTPLECTKLVIRYYRGADVLNPDPAQRGYDRAFLLNDIFHSSPVSVEPPTPKFFCGYTNQCLDTLYSGRTDKALYDTADGKKRDAYDEFVARHGDRDKVVLVGSNGGMLHAFHNGTKTGVDAATGLFEYDAGTGEELWAFVPPDLLSKLRARMGEHAYFVDGTPMVREVWLDGVGRDALKDGKKQAGEFRTVAVVGTGTGGVHRFALDLTSLLRAPSATGQASHRAPDQAGDFLWMWPQPCDALSTQLGESFSNFTPKPPPIGPVAMYDPDGPWKIGPDGQQKPAREQWVVMFNGGYDPYMVRGRGLAMVDMGTGETLWSFFHGDDTSKRPLADKLRYPLAAGAALLDLGNSPSSTGDADLLFDTATIADFGGQVWTVRFWAPGEREEVDGKPGQVKNWFAARSFQVALDETQESDELRVRPAFSYITSNTIQPDTGYLRTFLGTGDRYHLVDNGTQCRLSNPRACAQLGCAVRTHIQISRDGQQVSQGDSNYVDYKYADLLPPSASDSGNACKSPKVALSWSYLAGGACTAQTGKLEYACSGDSSTWSCTSSTSEWVNLTIDAPPPAQSLNRYYGFWSYGVDASRTFNSRAEALLYDEKRLHDSDLVDVSQFDATGQVDVTLEKEAGSLDKGWLVRYGPGAERTGSGSTIVDGCVVWSSFEPSGATSAVCSTTGTNTARIYQASFVSGKANCAASFVDASQKWVRYIKSTTVAAPPEPAPQRTLVNGKVYSSAVVPGVGGGGGGGNQQFIIGENKEVLQSLYQIELDPEAHTCRHDGKECK